MTVPAEHSHRRIYHFTHIDNLPGLLKTGFLSNNHPQFPRSSHRSVAAQSIQSRRATMPVTCGPGGHVHDYVPLYFGCVSPMLLSVINTKNVDQFDILYFEFPIQIVENPEVVFTDASANTLVQPNFFSAASELNQLDWKAIDSRKWGSESDDVRHRRMAEALVHNHLPLSAAAQCVTWNDGVSQQVKKIVDASGSSFPPIGNFAFERPHWFTGFATGSKASVVTGPREISWAFEAAVATVTSDTPAAPSPAFATLGDLLDALRANFGALPQTAELVGLRSANGIHKHTVDVHTQDVVAKLLGLPGFKILEPKYQRLVELAAYLHDIGKGPKARWASKGGVQQIDPNHPVGAMPMMIDILTNQVAKVSSKSARRLLKLVCYHDLVGDILGRGRDERQLVDVAENRLDLDMLILLGQADASSLQEKWELTFVQKASALRAKCAPKLASDS